MFEKSANIVNKDINSRIQNFESLIIVSGFCDNARRSIIQALLTSKSALGRDADSLQNHFIKALDIATLQVEKYQVDDESLIIATFLHHYVLSQPQRVRGQTINSFQDKFGASVVNLLKDLNWQLADKYEFCSDQQDKANLFKGLLFSAFCVDTKARVIMLSEFDYILSEVSHAESAELKKTYAMTLLEVIEVLELKLRIGIPDLKCEKHLAQFKDYLTSVFPEFAKIPRLEIALSFIKTIDFICKNISLYPGIDNSMSYLNNLLRARDFELIDNLLSHLLYDDLNDSHCMSILTLTKLGECHLTNRSLAFKKIEDLYKRRGVYTPTLLRGLECVVDKHQ